METNGTLGKRVGHYMASHGFLRAYHGDTQVGSTATQDDDAREKWKARMAAKCSQREGGARVREFCGGFYRDAE